MSTLRTNVAGGGHAWPDVLMSKIAAAKGKEPAELPYEHALGRALDQLIGPFRHKPIVTALIAELIAELSLVENALWQVRDSRDIDLAKTDALLILGRLIQAKLHPRFADSTLRALLDNHAQATAAGETYADLERWILTFFDGVTLTESAGASLGLAASEPTAAMLDILDWKIDTTFEGYVASSEDAAPSVTPTDYDLSVSGRGIYVSPDQRWMTSCGSKFFWLRELGVPGQQRSAVLRANSLDFGSLITPVGVEGIECVRYSSDGKWLFTSDERYVYKFATANLFSPVGITEVDEVLDTNPDTGGSALLGMCPSSTGDHLYVTTATTIYQYDLDAPFRFYDDFGVLAAAVSGTLPAVANTRGIEVHPAGEHLYQCHQTVGDARMTRSDLSAPFDITTAAVAESTNRMMSVIIETSINHDENVAWCMTNSGVCVAFTIEVGSMNPTNVQLQSSCSAWGPFTQGTAFNRPTSGGDYVHANGVDQRMSSTDADLLAALDTPSFAIAFRAARTSTGSARTLFVAREGATTRLKIGFDSSNRFFVTRGSSSVVVPDAIDTNEHAYTIAVNGSECTISVDGAEYTGVVGAAEYAHTSLQLFWTGAAEHFEGRLYSWAFFAGTANSITDLNDWAMGKPWPAIEYFIENLKPELTAGVEAGTGLSVAIGEGMYFSDATDPPETDSGTYFAIEEI